jgi:hypothetical protein
VPEPGQQSAEQPTPICAVPRRSLSSAPFVVTLVAALFAVNLIGYMPELVLAYRDYNGISRAGLQVVEEAGLEQAPQRLVELARIERLARANGEVALDRAGLDPLVAFGDDATDRVASLRQSRPGQEGQDQQQGNSNGPKQRGPARAHQLHPGLPR